MPDLPDELRDRAAIILHNTLNPADTGAAIVQRRQSTRERYGAAVDAVAEVLAEQLEKEHGTLVHRALDAERGFRKFIEAERDVLRARVVKLERHERERLANAQLQYSEAWAAYTRLLKRMGTAAGIDLPGDLHYHKYETLIVATVVELTRREAEGWP